MKMKKIFVVLCLLPLSLVASAQSVTMSPYSRYGLGTLAEQSQGFNRGMNGLAQGFRFSNQVNALNPASYSAIDSVTMVFDIGMAGHFTNYKEGDMKKNEKNASFEYAVASFRILKNLGMAVGILPFSNIGYNFETSLNEAEIPVTYKGDGGLHQVFLGMGWRIIKPLSVGFNFSYLWGDYTHNIISGTLPTTDVNSIYRTYTADISSFKLDLGAQYMFDLRKSDKLTLGATVSIGHNLGGEASCYVDNTEVSYTIEKPFSLPMMYSFGVVWNHKNNLFLGADLNLQQWGSKLFPVFDDTTTDKYVLREGQLKNRTKVVVGGEWIPNPVSRDFFKRVHYRMGISYATPYYYINGADGPKEFSISAGFGLPIANSYNNRSILNISGQWVHSSATGMITENTFRINIGLTFNERWFMKWKVE